MLFSVIFVLHHYYYYLIMKRFLLFLTFVCMAAALNAQPGRQHFAGVHLFDVAPNEELYSDMLVQLDNFAGETTPAPVSKEVKAFASEVKKAHKTDKYIWISQVFQFVEKLQADYTPVVIVPGHEDMAGIIRKNIGLLLDFPMHCDEMSAKAEDSVKAFYPHVRDLHYLTTHERLMEWLRLPAPAENEIRIAKVYSSGFLFRTHEHMLAVDVRWQGCEDDAFAICNKADLFVLSHNHGDHYSLNVMERMMIMGKPVIVPGNNFHETSISSVLSTYSGANKIVWDGPMGTRYPLTQVGPAKVEAVMAAQGDEPCLLSMIELDGWRIAAVGDNSHHEFQTVYSEWEAPDFVCTPIFQGFQNILGHIAKAPSADKRQTYYLPMHENEMHHGVSHRVGYRFLYYHQGALNNSEFEHYAPYVLLDGGEGITFSKK